jgi:plastocyanin
MRSLVFAAAVLLVLGTACGDDTTSPNEVVIEMRDNVFFPATTTIQRGTSVRWRNTGNTAHNSTRLGTWQSGTVNPGQSFTRVFDTPGVFEYLCTLHAGMTGTVTVN